MAARSVAAHVPKIVRGVLPSLFKLLEEGGSDAQKAAAWWVVFLQGMGLCVLVAGCACAHVACEDV